MTFGLLILAAGVGASSGVEPAGVSSRWEEPTPVVHVVRTLAQVRFRQTSVTVLPALEELVQSEFSSPGVADDALRTIRDTAAIHDGLTLRRLWFELEADPVENIRGELRLDLARLLDDHGGGHHGESELHHMFEVALAEARVASDVVIAAGLVEAPFSVWELVHDPEFELAEKGPTYDLVEHIGYAGSHVGAVALITPLERPEWLGVSGGVFDGEALGAQDVRAPGLFSGRLLSEPLEWLRVGGSVAWRPFPVDAWVEEQRFRYRERDRGVAYATDVTLSFDGLVLRGEWLKGDRTDNDVETPLKRRRGDARSFMGLWGLAALRLPVGLMAFTPALRAEWLDVDREHDSVGNILHLSAALNVDFTARLRLSWDLSQHYVQPGSRNWDYDIGRYDTDYLSGTMQLQARL
jgi:hypothetical protein